MRDILKIFLKLTVYLKEIFKYDILHKYTVISLDSDL